MWCLFSNGTLIDSECVRQELALLPTLQTLMILEYSKTQTEIKVNCKTKMKFGVRNSKGLGTWEEEGHIELSQEPGVTMRSHTRKRLLCQ